MAEHGITRVREQHGPDAMCAVPYCGRSAHWDVMADEWIHNLTVAEAEVAAERMNEDLIAMARGLAAALYPLRAGAETPDEVERYLRGTK